MSWYYKCKYCESFQQGPKKTSRGLCEEKGEERGPMKECCGKFRMVEEVRKELEKDAGDN